MIQVTTKPFGRLPQGQQVTAYTLTNTAGLAVTVLDYGGIIQSLLVPTDGGPVDVVLGYPRLEGYLTGGGYLGALIGRNANRLADAYIEIDGKRYPLTANEGKKQLHGGFVGFDKKMFEVAEIPGGIALTCHSADGEEGYPGNLTLTAHYTLDDAGALTIDYRATADRDTVVNLTNHSYFNLNGGGDATGHQLRINASSFTPIDGDLLPTGVFSSVEGTPFDFRQFHTIGERLGEQAEQLLLAGGYDHNFVLNKEPGALAEAAVLVGDKTGITLTCSTTCPGVQLYSANSMDENAEPGKGGHQNRNREAVCLETQYFPAANRCTDFPSTVLRAGEEYHEVSVYAFSVR